MIKTRAARLMESRSTIGHLLLDLLSLDNTNTKEDNFTTVKSHTPSNDATRLDISVTSMNGLHWHQTTPTSMRVMPSLVESLATIVSCGVIAVLSSLRVYLLLNRVVVSDLNILSYQLPSGEA